MFVFVFDESLFVFANETPAFELALLFERYTTRADDDWGNLPFRGLLGCGRASPSCIVYLHTFKVIRLGYCLGLQEGRDV